MSVTRTPVDDDLTPNPHGRWENYTRPADEMGPPAPSTPGCSYCGSMHPDAFLAAVRAGCKIGGADWKYGYPHKLYVDVPNPNPTEERITGSSTRDGVTTPTKGTYPVLHLKFYTEHFKGWAPLKDPGVRDEIEKACGVYYEVEADTGRLKYRAPYPDYQHDYHLLLEAERTKKDAGGPDRQPAG